MFQVDNVILSDEIVTEYFCCDLAACHGRCCEEGDAGAPLLEEEIARMEEVLPVINKELTRDARDVIERQGVAYVDKTGDLVTSIVDGRDCVFACRDASGCLLCASDRAHREGRTRWSKPISCYLYPIREKRFVGGLVGLNYHRWDICEPARRKGRELKLPVYRFLREPLIARFGEKWYEELERTVTEMKKHRLL